MADIPSEIDVKSEIYGPVASAVSRVHPNTRSAKTTHASFRSEIRSTDNVEMEEYLQLIGSFYIDWHLGDALVRYKTPTNLLCNI